MMDSGDKTTMRCSQCEELQRLYLTALQDKRTILVRLQNELENGRKIREELDALRRQERLATGQKIPKVDNKPLSHTKSTNGPELERRLNEAMMVNRKWKDEFEELKEKYKTHTKNLQEEMNCLRQKVEENNTHIYALESENIRLAQALSGRETPHGENCDESQLMKFQMQAYKEDFSCERRDRERAQSEKDNLQEQLNNAKDVISTLTEEVEVYKTQHESNRDEIRRLMNRQTAQPQFQIVYPIVDQDEHRQQNRWRQQQQRKGIYARGPTLPPPSVFYGGDVEIDQPDGGIQVITDGYRTI